MSWILDQNTDMHKHYFWLAGNPGFLKDWIMPNFITKESDSRNTKTSELSKFHCGLIALVTENKNKSQRVS